MEFTYLRGISAHFNWTAILVLFGLQRQYLLEG
jgi:hypothetical protein